MNNLPQLQTVMVMLGPTDFKDCSSVSAELFNSDDASGYAFQRHASLIYYLEVFCSFDLSAPHHHSSKEARSAHG